MRFNKFDIISFSDNPDFISNLYITKPGTTPLVTKSENESNCLPIPLSVFSKRARKPSIKSNKKANKQKISEVTSPTFTVINEYQIKKTLIKHYDLYRIKNKKELNNLGIDENLKDQITLVEWPETVKKIKIKNSINLIFEYKKNYTKRYLSIISENKKFLNEFK